MFQNSSIVLLAAGLFLLPQISAAAPLDISTAPAYPELYAPVEPGGDGQDHALVLLGADLVEVVVALGAADQILARMPDIDLPGIEDTPHIVREWSGVEGILALSPGIVVGSSVREEKLLTGLSDLGVAVAMIDRALPATEKIARMADILGLPERGAALIASVEADYAAIEPVRVDGRPVRILHASKLGAGSSGAFTAGGAATAVHNLIERVGGVNVAAEIGKDRYRSVTPEGVMMMAPDVVIISVKETEAFGGVDGVWDSYPGLALTPAGQARNVIFMREMHVRSDAASSGIATKALAEALHEMFP